MKDFTPRSIIRFWWIPLFTGLISVVLGVWSLCAPLSSLAVFAWLFAAGFILAGVLNLAYCFTASKVGLNWGWPFAMSLLELICGIWLFTMPEDTLVATFLFFAGVMLLFGAINSIAEISMMHGIGGFTRALLILLMVATIVFALIFLANPISGAIFVWLWIGISLICFGVGRIILAFGLNSLNRPFRAR